MLDMSSEQGSDANAPVRGHRRSRSSRGSSAGGDVKGHSQKTKSMLSNALKRANVAVELDRAGNFGAARYAYLEACDYLHQVLEKTTGDEDKRKLEGIYLTYESRIDDLVQICASNNAQDDRTRPPPLDALDDDAPLSSTARPRSRQSHLRQQNDSFQESSRLPNASPNMPLQSIFSRQSSRPRTADEGLSASAHLPPPTMSVRPLSPARHQIPASARQGPVNEPNNEADAGHAREGSQNSWLDPIEESIGSARSSLHSRSPSHGYRRLHLRKTSGDTEMEFDTALDAAIEAAYDDGYEVDGYGQSDANDEVVNRVLRKVEMARERVRQTESDQQGPLRRPLPQQLQPEKREPPGDFFEDDSSEEEERMLDEIARDYGLQDFTVSRQRKASVSSRPESRGRPGAPRRTPAEANSAMESLPFSRVNGSAGPRMAVSKTLRPSAPPPAQSLPELPAPRSASAQSVRNRRLSGQNAKQLVIDTTDRRPPPPPAPATTNFENLVEQRRPATAIDPGRGPQAGDVARVATMPRRRPSPRTADIMPSEPMFLDSPPRGGRFHGEGDEPVGRRSDSPSTSKLRKNFSSSSLRSSKGRNVALSHVDDAPQVSPGTPSSSYQPGSARTGIVQALPTPLATTFREHADGSVMGGPHLFEDSFHQASSPSVTPTSALLNTPVPLEPCPNDFLLRPFWLMRCLYQTVTHPRGGYLSTKLFVPRDVWKVKSVKLKGVEDKIACCDYITARLQKLSRADTCDADAVLEEMEGLEVVLEHAQATLSRRLGSEVGVQGSGTLFKEASNITDADGASGMPRASNISSKPSFSWRRLRSKNSAIGLAGSYIGKQGGAPDVSKEQATMPTLPMTPQVASRPAKRDISQAQFMGPNASYMSSLARLFDAAQAVDQIARQIDDPGLRHADKTQVGLELCTRRVAEFFAFYICRFVLTDLGLLLDKFIKRGTEWVLA
ncbi:GTP-binding protein [Ophiocordyceps camponoti-floridani]|uniref:GTP-binding protein n=1 Tax=Ophiocordyceps camponoti-floridani TaxID=2030778 RepID=A0A8H4VFL6_9HYPO|nr:GTP-binding protein [Ophiocordyceps camponoti-floridani]